MRRLDVRERVSPWRQGQAVLALGITLAALLLFRWNVLDGALQTREAALRSSRARSSASASVSTKLTQQAEETANRRFSAAAAELNLPWEEIFVALEQSYIPDVTLLSIEPERESRLLKVTGQAATLEDAVTFAGRLSNRPILTETVLASFTSIPSETGGSGIKFVVTTRWKRV